jgi:hypothetical protein
MTAAAVNEGFPALSGARPDSRMSAVTSLPLYAPPAGARRTAVVELVGAAWLSTTVAAVLNGPVMRSEPVFASINVATTATLVTLGVYLMRAQSTRFTGWCFVLAGVSWLLTVTDTLAPAWGPLVHWVLSGVTYVALGWAILRYRRPRLAGRGLAQDRRDRAGAVAQQQVQLLAPVGRRVPLALAHQEHLVDVAAVGEIAHEHGRNARGDSGRCKDVRPCPAR